MSEELLLELLEEKVEAEEGEEKEAEVEKSDSEEKRGELVYSVGPVTYIVSAERYRVVEPGLDPEVAKAVEAVAEYLARKGVEVERTAIFEAAEELGLGKAAARQPDAFAYYVEKRLSPWGFLYPLVIDRRLEDVSIANGTVMVRHREIAEREYIPVEGVEVPPEHELREYAQRLASAFGAAVNPAFPIAEFDAGGARVTIVLGGVAHSTSISVRLHPERPLTLKELVDSGTVSEDAARYLLEVLRQRGVVFIVGPQGSGKTTLVNALLDQLPEDWKIVVIEDVPEVRLARHKHWVSLRTRRIRSLAAAKETEVTFRDLVRVALRLGGQVTTITEARGEEVRELLEVAALGEAAIATFHARDWDELRARLELLGVGRDYLSLLWAVAVMRKVRLDDGRVVRRVVAVYEVLPDAREHLVFRYDPEHDRLVCVEAPRRVSVPLQCGGGSDAGKAGDSISGGVRGYGGGSNSASGGSLGESGSPNAPGQA